MEIERALERIKEAKALDKGLICRVFQLYPKEIEAIEKHLKALEIIKEKPIVALVDYEYTYEKCLELAGEKSKYLFKSKKEYELLKEVLK